MRCTRTLAKILGILTLSTAMVCGERFYFNDLKSPETREDLEAIQSALQKHVEKSRAATVCIELGQGSGTGVIVSETGLVLTAAHVVGGIDREVTVIMEDGTKYEAQSLGLNAENDAAMVQIVSEEGKKFPYVEIEKKVEAGQSTIRVGDWVYAIGHSGGFDKERGSVVRLGRMLRVGDSTVYSDCKLIGGDSGGPLFDMYGTLIGIHSRVGRILTQNLHVPLQAFHREWDILLGGEFVGDGPFAAKPVPGTGFMGVRVEESEGVLRITEVEPKYPADAAGLRVGDILKSVNGVELQSRDDLKEVMDLLSSDEKIKIEYLRDEVLEEISLTLGQK